MNSSMDRNYFISKHFLINIKFSIMVLAKFQQQNNGRLFISSRQSIRWTKMKKKTSISISVPPFFVLKCYTFVNNRKLNLRANRSELKCIMKGSFDGSFVSFYFFFSSLRTLRESLAETVRTTRPSTSTEPYTT